MADQNSSDDAASKRNQKRTPQRATSSWEELRDHARFEALATLSQEASVEVAAGRYDCWQYAVGSVDERGPFVTTYWFAKDKPGPPVKQVVDRQGEVEFVLELVEHRAP